MKKTDPLSYEACLELLHFGFRNITEGPDRMLVERGLARAHHRILYFIGRAEEIPMSDLLHILGISRQALHRPMKQLREQGLIAARPDPADKRNLILSLTDEGRSFEHALTEPQRQMFAAARGEAGDVALTGWRAIMEVLARGTPWDDLKAEAARDDE
ncbi:MAG TPA: MarR family transcriptional regulator [Aliiroseovarius sp.]|nr:MarR family transcriptional regulator [Aliiroseovarius sp.]